jgi:hypothetical protein
MRRAQFLATVGLAFLAGTSLKGAGDGLDRSNETATADKRLLDASNAGDLAGVRRAIAAGAHVDARDAPAGAGGR